MGVGWRLRVGMGGGGLSFGALCHFSKVISAYHISEL